MLDVLEDEGGGGVFGHRPDARFRVGLLAGVDRPYSLMAVVTDAAEARQLIEDLEEGAMPPGATPS